MKIQFEDGSFLEIDKSQNDDNKLLIVLCGFKTATQLTMSSSELTKDDARSVIEFLNKWLEQK